MNPGYGQASVVADTTDYNLMELQINAALARLQTLSLAQVISCSNAGDLSPVGTVTIKILVNLMTGNGQAIQHGEIFDVPYVRMQGGTNAVILDPSAGDIGLVGFASRDISAVQSSKAQANPGSNRVFDWADAIYIGGMLNGTPTQYVQFSAAGIKIVSPTAITLQAPQINLTSPLIVTPAMSSLDEHVHPGVTSGGSNTGTPTA